MGYQYDVYFSYKRNAESDPWYSRMRDKLKYWVGIELGESPTIFFDREDIHPGHAYEQRMRHALRDSRCLVCFWSPMYFNAPWCQIEWLTFLRRSELTKRDLVLPASVHGREKFPERALQTQFDDFSDYHITNGDRFFSTEKAGEFEANCIKPFAIRLAHMIGNAPEHDEFEIADDAGNGLTRSPIIPRPADE